MEEKKLLLKKYIFKLVTSSILTFFITAGFFILVNKLFSGDEVSLLFIIPIIFIIIILEYFSIKAYLDIRFYSTLASRLRELDVNLYGKIIFLEVVLGIILLIFFTLFRMFYSI